MSTQNAQGVLSSLTDDRALALKMFWGQVFTSFRDTTILWNSIDPSTGIGSGSTGNVVASKSQTAGKSWEFPMIGEDVEPEEHDEGIELLGQQFEIEGATITVDKPLVSHRIIKMEHLELSHFDILGPAARSIGRSLATKMDRRGFITAALAAGAPALTKRGLTIHNGGNQVIRTAAATATIATAYPVSSAGAVNFRDDVAHLAQLMDEDNVPKEGRFLTFSPYIRRVLSKDTTIFNTDFTIQMMNSLNRRLIGEIEGFLILPDTLHLPVTNILAGSDDSQDKYVGDFSSTSAANGLIAAQAFCGASEGVAGVGYVSFGGIRPVMEDAHFHGTVKLLGRLLAGWGPLNPYCSGRIMVQDT